MSGKRTLILGLLLSSLLVGCGTSPAATPSPSDARAEQPSPPAAQPSEALPTSEPTSTSPPEALATLGLTRADAASFFQFLQFTFRLSRTPSGLDDFTGTVSDGLATVHILGPEDAVLSVSVIVDVPTPPTENQSSRTMAYLLAVLSVAAEDWSEGTQWLNQSLNVMGESRAAFNGHEAVLLLEPGADTMHVELTVAAVP